MTAVSPGSFASADRLSRAAILLLSFGGVAFTLLLIVIGSQAGLFPVPPGDMLIWDRVGDAVRAGRPVYFDAQPLTDSFWYAPPWAVALAAVTWLPPLALHFLLVGVKIASLRVIAGSWIGAGIASWFPLVAFDLASGSFNLLIAASIVAAVRGRPGLALVAALAKFGPLLAVDPRQWRSLVPIGLVALLVTLPWLSLWPAWISHIVENVGSPLGPEVPVPVLVRWLFAVGLLGLRRPWARALAASIAIPAFYWGSLVILIAPVAVHLRERPGSESV